ncbi:MAG: putative membrane protein insertion efficiency factor [Candidatus Tokpelaia sp. JSC188]|nr:MAG: putative membrane protein insertion efficiency factor [Candidatus Tokpelaia sp. JSC188]
MRKLKKVSRNYNVSYCKTPGRLIGTTLVRCYQLTLSGFVGKNCRYLPTCSEYSYEAIVRHGLWTGGWIAFFRFIRCGPFGSYGFDPTPIVLESHYHWYTPWRCWKLGTKKNP